MWVKVADREEIAKFEIVEEANKVQTLIGETPDNFIGDENDMGIMLLCKTSLRLTSFEVNLEDSLKGEEQQIDVECYQYNGSNSSLIYAKPGLPGVAGINTLSCNIFLSPGKYFLRVKSKGGISIKNTNKINTSHHFLSIVGGSAVVDKVIPAYQELLNPTVWFGIYNINIQASAKSLHLGITDKVLSNDDLIPGAYYHMIKSGSLTIYVFDGTQQYSIS